MTVQRTVAILNRGFLALFLLMAVAGTIVAAHEIFFALPECPGGLADCPMRHGHWTGSRLIGFVLAGIWVIAGLWFLASRRAEHRGRAAYWIMSFWLLPIAVLGNLVPILFSMIR